MKRAKRVSPAPKDDSFGELDAHLMREGTHPKLFDKLGSHPTKEGVRFTVWAPHAASVSVVGDFNAWDPMATPLSRPMCWSKCASSLPRIRSTPTDAC